MSIVRGRGVRIEVGNSIGAAIPVSVVSVAHDAVVTAPAHGMAEYSIGYFDGVEGMVELEGQAAQVMGPSTDVFLARSLDTSQYESWLSGGFRQVTSWLTLAESTSYSIQVENPAVIDKTTILDKRAQREYGLGGAETLSCNLIALTAPSSALLLLQRAARAHDGVVVRITHPDGSTRVGRGVPSVPGEDVQQGAIGTAVIVFAITGSVLSVPSAAVTPSAPVQNYVTTDYLASDYVLDNDYTLEDYLL